MRRFAFPGLGEKSAVKCVKHGTPDFKEMFGCLSYKKQMAVKRIIDSFDDKPISKLDDVFHTAIGPVLCRHSTGIYVTYQRFVRTQDGADEFEFLLCGECEVRNGKPHFDWM